MSHQPLSFCYAILCGGKSRRMGRDKSLLTIDGQSIIERVVNDLNTSIPIQSTPLICSASKRYSQLANQNIQYLDDYLTDYQGPLSGLAAALQYMVTNQQLDTQWLFTLPSDTLLLPSQTFHLFEQAIQNNPAADMVYLAGERDHPLHAAYRIDIAESLFCYLADGNRAVMKFVNQLENSVVEIPNDWNEYLNFNTEDGYNKAIDAYSKSS